MLFDRIAGGDLGRTPEEEKAAILAAMAAGNYVGVYSKSPEIPI